MIRAQRCLILGGDYPEDSNVVRLFRKSIADAKDVAARAWQARARRLETSLSMLKSRGMELSMPDQDKVSMLNSGGAARRGGMALDATRDATLAASLPMIESLEHMAENRESKHKAMDDLFSDGKFLGTHLAAVSWPLALSTLAFADCTMA